MKTILKLFAVLAAALLSLPAAGAVRIFACEPEWAALAREIGGDKVSATAATTAMQDAHHIEARPSLIARTRNADLLVCSGSDLEIGWLPLLLTQSGNSRIQRGSPGYLEASQYVAKLEVPAVVDRALGDVHPGGNPHIHLDPRNIGRVAVELASRLERLDAANAEYYRTRAAAFAKRWQAAIDRWQQEGAPLKGITVVVYHKDLSYFIHWMGMREVGSLEPKPGIPPTPAHLAELIDQMKRNPAKVIVYSPYNDPRAAQFLSEKTGIPSVMMPFTIGGTDQAKDLYGLFDDTIARLLKAVQR